VGCTGDLQAVTDADGNVVEQCPPDQGCAAGACVPACKAASLSTGNIGCQFYTAESPYYQNGQASAYAGACYALFVANTLKRAPNLTVTRGTQTFDVTQFGYLPKGLLPNIVYDPMPASGLPPNAVAVLFLSRKPGGLACPKEPALVDDAAVQGSGRGAAFRVES